MDIQVKDIQEFFFEAMMQGYAGDGNVTRVFDMPGFKRVEVNRGPWRCIDQWSSYSDSNRSTGATFIWHQDIPVWDMHYGGWYSPDVVWFLKAALKSSYERKLFYGCRGPNSFKIEGLEYSNRWQAPFRVSSLAFRDFSGKEEIRRIVTQEVLGYHEYFGMSLLP